MPSRPLIIALLTAAALLPAAAAVAEPTPPEAAPERYVVLLADTTRDPGAVAREHASAHGAAVRHVYAHALKGYAATLPAARVARLRQDPRVVSVTPDVQAEVFGKPRPAPAPAQSVPTGIARTGSTLPSSVDADVAVIDSGVDASHPDLDVVGGYWCGEARPDGFGTDPSGHGTHVAGTAAARNNGVGVVGVAPGARIWSFRVPDRRGVYYLSAVACAVDRIAALRDSASGGPLIEAANISLGFSPAHNGFVGEADDACGATTGDPLHKAICGARALGTTFVAAAGNGSTDAQRLVPAGYSEVITVSALADFDGATGGRAGATTTSTHCRADVDDTAADFSSYGSDVDLIAPGVCIRSTVPGGYGDKSGTSMAAPHVTGAAALVASLNTGETPDRVQAHLVATGTLDYSWGGAGDPDGVVEPLLNLRNLVFAPSG